MRKAVFFCILFLIFSCSRNYIARIGSRKITPEEFKNRMLEVPYYYRGFLETQGGRKLYLDGIVNELLLVELAKAKGIHRRPQIKERIQMLEDQILLESIVEELKKDQLKVTDEEIEKFWEEHKDMFVKPQRVRVSHILVDDKSKAEEILKKIKEGASFSELAKKFSLDRESSHRGGDLGYFERGIMVPEFEKAAFSLKEIGEISPLVKTPFGWHIVKLTGKKTAESKTKEEAKEDIIAQIQKEKLDKLLEYYKRKLHVKVNYDKLSEITPPWEDVEEESEESNQ